MRRFARVILGEVRSQRRGWDPTAAADNRYRTPHEIAEEAREWIVRSSGAERAQPEPPVRR
ncbi:MAG: hypothetical protein JOZ24_00135 [Candidatus Eremiobacteraeota bacterium]|nr:hypothetical protein [Candidatus Eremiobacteraeota bacterium]